jgi:hypothetical protein
MRGIGKTALIDVPAALMLVASIAGCGAQAARHSPGARRAVTTGSTAPAQSADATALLTNIAFTSPSRGYGLFQREAGAHCQALSGRTADGGASFGLALAITSWNCNNQLPLVTAIATDGAGNVLAYGPRLFILRHGSAQWHRSSQPGAVLAVSAAGRSVWMVLADCREAARDGGRCTLQVRQSSDGGQSWSPARAQPAGAWVRGASGGPFTEPALGQTWLLRTGPHSAYVSAYPAISPQGRPDSVPLWYTSDGGSSWSRRRLPCGIDAMSAAVGSAGRRVLAAVCADEPSAGNQLKTAAFSVNGGRTWTVHATCLKHGVPSCQDRLFEGYLSQVAALSSRTAYLIGGRGPLLRTTDGGLRWHQVGALGDENGVAGQVMFFGRLDGVVVGDSAATGAPEIWHTVNGGRRWTLVTPHLR